MDPRSALSAFTPGYLAEFTRGHCNKAKIRVAMIFYLNDTSPISGVRDRNTNTERGFPISKKSPFGQKAKGFITLQSI